MKMFNAHTAQPTDQVLVDVKGQIVTGIIDSIRPHTINMNKYIVMVTLDTPVKVWSDTDIRDGFSITHDIRDTRDRVTNILA